MRTNLHRAIAIIGHNNGYGLSSDIALDVAFF
jgi:hypothetical protein